MNIELIDTSRNAILKGIDYLSFVLVYIIQNDYIVMISIWLAAIKPFSCSECGCI